MEQQHAGEQFRHLLRRRDLVAILGGAALAWSPGARAQTARKRPLIAALDAGSEDTIVAAFLDGMRDHGYVEGQDFDFALRSAHGDYGALTLSADEMVLLKPDVIVAISPPAVGVVQKATSAIPIVAPLLVNPDILGLIESYPRPGGNLTGISVIVEGVWGKVVEIAHELIPSATAIGLLLNPDNPAHVHQRPEIEAAVAQSGMKLVVAGASAKADLDRAIRALVAANVQAVILIGDRMFLGERERIVASVSAARLPMLSNIRQFVEAGALMSYGINPAANVRRAAYLVDKILKGAKPADLPVEIPVRVEMVLNLKAAKALGLVVPLSVMVRADEVIQ